MAKKLRVLTPQTIDGTTLQYDDNRQPVYKASYVEVTAVKHFESLNASLPTHLRHILEVGELEGGKFTPSNDTEPKNKAKKNEKKGPESKDPEEGENG